MSDILEMTENTKPGPLTRGRGSFGTIDEAIQILPLSPEATRDSFMRGQSGTVSNICGLFTMWMIITNSH